MRDSFPFVSVKQISLGVYSIIIYANVTLQWGDIFTYGHAILFFLLKNNTSAKKHFIKWYLNVIMQFLRQT